MDPVIFANGGVGTDVTQNSFLVGSVPSRFFDPPTMTKFVKVIIEVMVDPHTSGEELYQRAKVASRIRSASITQQAVFPAVARFALRGLRAHQGCQRPALQRPCLPLAFRPAIP